MAGLFDEPEVQDGITGEEAAARDFAQKDAFDRLSQNERRAMGTTGIPPSQLNQAGQRFQTNIPDFQKQAMIPNAEQSNQLRQTGGISSADIFGNASARTFPAPINPIDNATQMPGGQQTNFPQGVDITSGLGVELPQAPKRGLGRDAAITRMLFERDRDAKLNNALNQAPAQQEAGTLGTPQEASLPQAPQAAGDPFQLQPDERTIDPFNASFDSPPLRVDAQGRPRRNCRDRNRSGAPTPIAGLRTWSLLE